MLPRFYVPVLDPAKALTLLPPEEAHHLTRVLRLKRGDTISVFDGRGAEWRARVEWASRESVTVALLEPVAIPIPRVAVTLVQAALKGAAMDDVIRDCTMLGITTVQVVVTERTTVKAGTLAAGPDRWRRIAVASAKQCGAARLPEIADVRPFGEWLDVRRPEDCYILLEPHAAAAGMVTIRQLAHLPIPSTATLMVGPEGGWTGQERDIAIAAGCTPLSLGPMTLRADAVAVAATAALLGVWQE